MHGRCKKGDDDDDDDLKLLSMYSPEKRYEHLDTDAKLLSDPK